MDKFYYRVYGLNIESEICIPEFTTIEKLQEYHGLIAQDANILKRSTAYILNQVVNKGKIYLQCTQAGTTASTALDLSNVDLDDELVAEYCKYETLREHPFCIVILSQFGHNPTVDEISDKELSKLCNEILLDELKALSLLPEVIKLIERRFEDLNEYAEKGIAADMSV